MENASKALIIAGAILLSILLISLGIMIFTQAQDTVNNNGMSEAEIAAFNNKFIKYEGTQSGTVVRAMVNEVLASNAKNESHPVAVRGVKKDKTKFTLISKMAGYTPTELINNMSSISTNSTYTVTLEYDNSYVSSIVLNEN